MEEHFVGRETEDVACKRGEVELGSLTFISTFIYVSTDLHVAAKLDVSLMTQNNTYKSRESTNIPLIRY